MKLFLALIFFSISPISAAVFYPCPAVSGNSCLEHSPSSTTITMTMANGGIAVPATGAGGYSLARTIGFSTVGSKLDGADTSRIVPGFLLSIPGLSDMIPRTAAFGLNFGDPSSPAALFIAANGLDQDYMVRTSSSPLDAPLRVPFGVLQTANANIAGAGKYTYPLGNRIWEVSFLQADGTTRAPREKIQGTITLPYADADDNGVVDGSQPPVRTSTLAIWWLDEDHSLWVRLPDSVVNPAAKTVTAAVRYASVFAVMGTPDEEVARVRAFPSPWRPNGPRSGGGAGGSGTAAGLTFTNLPSLGTIRIYTLSGALVKEILHTDGSPQHAWDGKNDGGEDVATGVYVFTVESSGGVKSGKVAVIR